MRNFLVALSLANLLFLRAWERSKLGIFLDDFKPDGASIAFCVVITCLLLYGSWRLVSSSPKLSVAGKIVFLVLLLIPVNALRLYWEQTFIPVYTRKYDFVVWVVLAILLLPLVYAGVTRRLRLRFLVRYGMSLVLLLAPFTLFTLGGVSLDLYRANFSAQPPAARPASRARESTTAGNHEDFQSKTKRVVWIVFDEFDERVAFKERPTTLWLPEFDRFRLRSLVASSAYPPAGDTAKSIPALLNGKRVSSITSGAEKTLTLWNENERQPVIWDPGMTLFAETASEGITNSLVGTYYPYCATLDVSIDDCRDFRRYRDSEGFRKRITRAMVMALDAVPLSFRLWLRKFQLENEIERYEFSLRESISLAADPGFQLVFIHFPVPHQPGIYDRPSGRLDISSKHSYLDNLALADASFGSLRRAMEQSGVWDESTVIVTSDHWWRTYLWSTGPHWTPEDQQISAGREPDHRVPFMVKLSGSNQQLPYDRPFNTVTIRKMVMAILKGSVRTEAELAQWLDRNAVGPVAPM